MDASAEIPADFLVGRRFPNVSLVATTGAVLEPEDFATGSFVLFIYPRTGRPDHIEPAGWSLVPGAKGCTTESCEFRDLAADYAAIGYRLYGLSSQESDYQHETVERLHLTYPLLSDPGFSVATELGLPSFEFDGEKLHVRSTLVVVAGNITHANLGITDAATHPRRLLAQLRRDP